MEHDRGQASFGRLDRLFRDALACPAAEREAFLVEACGGDAILMGEVLALLAQDEQTSGPLDLSTTGAEGSSASLPERIGRYRIIARIGAGGMGVVYEAEQESPQRTVALKVINPGVTTPSMIRRLEFEAEILGKLQHPGIAQIFEAGTFDAGAGAQPYFAMELIRGRLITDHAAAQELGTRARLDLVLRVCEAVQHAHQRGVIHRDLKPGNILIDETGQPKVLDFGVARTTDSDVETTTLRTDIGQLIGTIPYMSPEQAGGDSDEIDTRSDVYALGVIAYELLAGRLPHDLRQRLVHEAVRVIREDPPTPLSSISRVFRGDVETIVGKALAKDKTRRYQSASDLASDLSRYLKNEPIAARPPSRWYQARMFARRHKAAVTGVAAVMLALAAGTVVSVSFAIREATARADEFAQRTHAEQQAAIAGAINEFLTDDLLGSVIPSAEAGQGYDVRMREVLDAAAARLEGSDRFAGQPEVEAAVRQTLGRTYRLLGELPSAEPHTLRALELFRAALGPDHPYAVDALRERSVLLSRQGRFDEADASFVEALAASRRVHGEDHVQTAGVKESLALMRSTQGRYDESETLYGEAIACLTKQLGPEHPETLGAMGDLGLLYREQARYDEALATYERVLEIRRRRFGLDDPATLLVQHNLAGVYGDLGRFREQEPMWLEILARCREVYGPDHLRTVRCEMNLAHLYDQLGRDDEAAPILERVVARQSEVLGAEHPDTLMSRNNLALSYLDLERYDEAEAIWGEVLAIRDRVLGPDHPHTLNVLNNMAVLAYQQNDLEAARDLMVRTLESRRRALGPEHPGTLQSMSNVAGLERLTGRVEEAERLYDETIRLKRRIQGDDHPDTLVSLHGHATTLIALERFADAEPVAIECHAGNVKQFGATHAETADAVRLLVKLYEAWSRPDDAAAWRKQLPDTGE